MMSRPKTVFEKASERLMNAFERESCPQCGGTVKHENFHYSDNESGLSDTRVALKYQRLGQESERKRCQCKLRRARLRAEGRRTGHHIRGLMRAA